MYYNNVNQCIKVANLQFYFLKYVLCCRFTDLQIVHCKNELVILTLIWLHKFQCSIDNNYASDV